MTIAIEQVEQFLYEEARYLDDKDWDSWIEMYSEDASYWVPAWDDDGELTEDPYSEISLIFYATRSGLEDRVFRINTEKSSASSLPPTRTLHNLSNIEVISATDDELKVRFNWTNYGYRYQQVYNYFGTSHYVISLIDGQLKIKEKKVILKNDYIHHLLDIYHI